jgi:hypothetical protein
MTWLMIPLSSHLGKRWVRKWHLVAFHIYIRAHVHWDDDGLN